MSQIDLLSIGDITIDNFIKIHEAEVEYAMNKRDSKLCFGFGDKIPYDYLKTIKATGNSSNVAVSAKKLGLNTGVLSFVGDDKNGQECLAGLKESKIIPFVQIQKNKNTNCNFVLWYGVDRTILTRHENFSYDFKIAEMPRWIYLTSVGKNSVSFHNKVADFVEESRISKWFGKKEKIKMAFQPGTFQIKMGKDILRRIYKNTEIFFCNVEEAQTILETESRDLLFLCQKMLELGPKKVVITDSIEGAYAYDGTNFWFLPSYPGKPFERTGAGDAFSSTIVSALVLGKSFEEALLWGPINAMSVVKHIGAQEGLLSQKEIEQYLKEAPENYKLEKIN